MKVLLQVFSLLLVGADAFTTPTAIVSSLRQDHQALYYRGQYLKDKSSSTLLSMNNQDGTNENASMDLESIKASTMDAFSNIDTSIDLDIDTIKANVLEGEVGTRGEVWTAAWLVLFSCVLLGGIPIPFLNNLLSFLGGPGLMIGGGAVVVSSLSDLGSDNLTPFLTPVSGGSLITEGIFGKIRHPIYAGLIALCAGFSILTGSAVRLVITALLIVVLDIKSDKEEEMLSKAYPDYAAYKEEVTGKFIPGDWMFRE